METRKLELITVEALRLVTEPVGGVKGRYLRWEERVQGARTAVEDWRYAKRYARRPSGRGFALWVIGMQTFSGLRPEWVDEHLPRMG